MAEDRDGGTHSSVAGGTQQGPVLQGRDFRNVQIITNQAPAPVALAQLPAAVVGFTGRVTELAQVTGLLDPAEVASTVVVTAVAGLAGVGKTALAIQAGHAARTAGWFPGGALFIDLHGYDEAPVEPGQALDALLRALGIPGEQVPPGTEERGGLWRSVLAQINQPVLIIADNASSEAQVRPLLPGAGLHRIMVTSRHTLAGLGARLLDVPVLDADAGVALLDAALRAARPDDDRISANGPESIRLVEMCEGLPLALQIIAALLKEDPSRMVNEITDDLADEMRRLEALQYDDGSGTSAPSVAAAFELSYQRLDDVAARVFRLIPINPGPNFSATAIAALVDLPAGKVRNLISRLVRAHLVEAAVGAVSRWRMHDLLRLYAGQLSDAHADNDRREQARARLLRYYIRTVRAADAHLRALPDMQTAEAFSDRDDAFAWLDSERPNLLAAVVMAGNTGHDEDAGELAASLPVYLSWRRRLDDLLALCIIGLEAARRLGNRPNEAAALNDLGNTLLELRRFEEAITAYRDAVEIFQEIDAPRFRAMALNHLGIPLREIGQIEEAITAHQDARAIFRGIGDLHSEGDALGNLAVAFGDAHRFDEAISAQQDAAAIFAETGDQRSEAKALMGIGYALEDVQQFEEAIIKHQRAIALFQELGDLHSEGETLNNMGNPLRKLDRFEEAMIAHQGAAAIFAETGDRYGEAVALNNLRLDLEAKAKN